MKGRTNEAEQPSEAKKKKRKERVQSPEGAPEDAVPTRKEKKRKERAREDASVEVTDENRKEVSEEGGKERKKRKEKEGLKGELMNVACDVSQKKKKAKKREEKEDLVEDKKEKRKRKPKDNSSTQQELEQQGAQEGAGAGTPSKKNKRKKKGGLKQEPGDESALLAEELEKEGDVDATALEEKLTSSKKKRKNQSAESAEPSEVKKKKKSELSVVSDDNRDDDRQGHEETAKKPKKRKKQHQEVEEDAAVVVSDTGKESNKEVNGVEQEVHVASKKKKKRKEAGGSEKEQNEGAESQGAVVVATELGSGEVNGTKGASKKARKSAPGTGKAKVPESAATEKVKDEIAFSPLVATSWANDEKRKGLKYGKFDDEEDEIIKAAVEQYIKEHTLGPDGVQKLLKSRQSKETKGAWLEIGRCLPERSIKRVHARAMRLLHEGNNLGKWTQEEVDQLIKLHETHGNKWTVLGKLLGRMPESVKDKWREIGVSSRKGGHWTSEEKDLLCRLVQSSLEGRSQPGKVQQVEVNGRQIRSDIDWAVISMKMGTRTPNQCLQQWYYRLAPSMIAGGEWSVEDDRAMLKAILESKEAEEHAVDWGSLLEHRDGSTCRKRWRMMVKHLPEGGDFLQNLFRLCSRFAPELLELLGEDRPS